VESLPAEELIQGVQARKEAAKCTDFQPSL